jgi:hypothetical protein
MCHLSRGEGCRAAGDCKCEHDKSDATHHPSHTDEVRNTELSRARRASSSSRRPPFLRGPVTFSVTNKGKIPHDFKIAGKKTPLLKPGKSAELTVTLKKAGTRTCAAFRAMPRSA